MVQERECDSATRQLLTIAIPSFNRPEFLARLLKSIDTADPEIEVLVSDDCSPNMAGVRRVLNDAETKLGVSLRVFEQQDQLGYDANLRWLVENALGRFVTFMGDDDEFLPGGIDALAVHLRGFTKERYLLRSYVSEHSESVTEKFTYSRESHELEPGITSVAWLYKRSVSLSGFTICTSSAREVATDRLDGFLLYQVYLMAQVCMTSPSYVWNRPFVKVNQTFRNANPAFGSAKSEAHRFTPGEHSPENSLAFSRGFLEVAEFIDAQHGTDLKERVARQVSIYSYPFLSVQRKNGIPTFLKYSRDLKRLGFGSTWHFEVYKLLLVILGEKNSDRLIRLVKRMVGHAPNLD